MGKPKINYQSRTASFSILPFARGGYRRGSFIFFRTFAFLETKGILLFAMGLFNRPSEKRNRQTLRKNMPKAEVILWKKLKGKQVGGHRFRRQYSIGNYIVDFFCPELMLAVEVDGDSHFKNEASRENDRKRQAFIENQGISFLRFTNADVYNGLEGVLMAIEDFGEKKATPPAPPLKKGRIVRE